MKRVITFSVLLTFLFGAMVYATETRVMTMGQVNNIVADEANISLYPSTINYYPKLFLGEFDEDDYWKVGAHFQLAQESNPFVIGAYFSQWDYYHSIFGGPKTETSADHRIHLFYGRNLGEIPFGFGVGYYNDSEKNEDTATVSNYDQSLTRIEIGLGISPMEKKLDIGAGIAFTTWKDEDYVGSEANVVKITEPSGNMDIMVNGRYWMDPMGNYVLIPHASFMYSKQGADYYGDLSGSWAVDYTFEITETIFDLGFGMNYEADEDVLVVGDLGVALENFKFKTDIADPAATDGELQDNVFVLPYFKIGIDAKVLKWLDLRSGVWTRWERETFEPDAVQKRVYSDSYTDTYFGAGFHWGKFFLDAEINTDFIENGPYFISGENDYLTEQVTLKYMF